MLAKAPAHCANPRAGTGNRRYDQEITSLTYKRGRIEWNASPVRHIKSACLSQYNGHAISSVSQIL